MMPLLNQVPDGHLNFSGERRRPRHSTVFDGRRSAAGGAHRRTSCSQEMRGIARRFATPRISGDLPRPEIVVHPRLDIAAQLGVSVQSISQTIRIATLGDLPQNGAKFSLSDRQIPIRVSLIESARRDLTTLGEPAGADGLRRQRAAQVRGRPELRPGALGGAPLQPKPPRIPRGRHEPRGSNSVRPRRRSMRCRR